jgi:hypothetical protein
MVDRLKEIKFKVILNVNSLKLWAYVENIEEWEANNTGVSQSTLLQFDSGEK